MKVRTFVKICPRCGSLNITNSTGLLTVGGEIAGNICLGCGYGASYGGLFPEVEMMKVEAFRKQLRGKSE